MSRFHVLNQKASARLYCREHGLNYEDINLVVVHMGGGTSVAAHKKGAVLLTATTGLTATARSLPTAPAVSPSVG